MNLKKVKDSASIREALRQLLAEEITAWYAYWIVSPFLVGNERPSVEKFFQETADDELNDHANKLINRLNELNCPTGLDDINALTLVATAVPAVGEYNVVTQLNINKEAEEHAIEHYTQVIALAEQTKDYTTAELLKEILADEEQHLSDINDFLNDILGKVTKTSL